MRGRAVAFFGLVAIVASCSSYGEDVANAPEPAPSVSDGGSSSSGAPMEAGPDGAAPLTDAGGDVAIDGASPTVVQYKSAQASSGATELEIACEKPIQNGNGVLVLIATSADNVANVLVGGFSLDLIEKGGPFNNHAVFFKPLSGAASKAQKVNVLFTNGPANPLVTVVELANATLHSTAVNTGTGDIAVPPMTTKPHELVIASVLANGSPPDKGPLNAEPLAPAISFNGMQLLSAQTVALGEQGPTILWTGMGAVQWDSILISFGTK